MKSCYVEYEMENMTCLVGWELAWELDVQDKGGGYGMKHDYDGEIGVIPWVSWGDLMVVCSVYIKVWIQVRTASRNSNGSVSLK